MRIFRRTAVIVTSLLLTLGLTACGNAATNSNTKVLKLALEIAPNALTTEMAQKAADQIKEETNGSVTVEIYPSGQLGSQRDFIESMMLGTIEIGYVSASSVEILSRSLSSMISPSQFLGQNTLRFCGTVKSASRCSKSFWKNKASVL